MNHIYKLKYDRQRNQLVAVSEITTGAGKVSGTGRARAGGLLRRPLMALTVLASSLMTALPALASSLPTGGKVVAGQGSISTPSATQMEVRQGSQRMVAEWNTFDIAEGHAVRFIQPDSSAVALNRVTGGRESAIMGSLSANGRVFLVNPNGVVFGRNAQVNTAGFAASTRDMRNEDFMKGNYTFSGTPASGAEIINQGSLTTTKGGFIVLAADRVRNEGAVRAPGGTVALAAARQVTLQLDSQGLTSVQVSGAVAQALVDNQGLVSAKDGRVYLTARGKEMALNQVLNVSGVVEADSMTARGGSIVLDGGDSGVVRVAGRVSADSSAGTGGRVTLEGENLLLTGDSHVSATGRTGGGTVLAGGGWQGKDSTVRNAKKVVMQDGARIDVSATRQGDGGTAVVWSDEYTNFNGRITARGGDEGGNGGKVETSSHGLLLASGSVSASAPKGKGGEWLLDPVDVTISDSGNQTADASTSGNEKLFTPRDQASSNIQTSAITDELNNGTSVTILTSSGSEGGQSGNITVASAISASNMQDATLTLKADGNININEDITATGTGKLNLNLLAAGSNNGTITVTSGKTLKSNGGDIKLDKVPGAGDAGNTNKLGIVLQGTSHLDASVASGTGGNITLTADNGVDLQDGAKLSGNTLNLTSTGVTGGNKPAIKLNNNTINFSGDASITGTQAGSGAGQASQGIQLTGTLNQTGDGNLNISGTAAAHYGVHLVDNAGITVKKGDLTVTGTGAAGTGHGINLGNNVTITTTDSGNITLNGTANKNASETRGKGINAGNNLNITSAGSLTLTGTSNQSGQDDTASHGVSLGNGTVLKATAGDLNITGTLNGTVGGGISLGGANANVTLDAANGNLNINGTITGNNGGGFWNGGNLTLKAQNVSLKGISTGTSNAKGFEISNIKLEGGLDWDKVTLSSEGSSSAATNAIGAGVVTSTDILKKILSKDIQNRTDLNLTGAGGDVFNSGNINLTAVAQAIGTSSGVNGYDGTNLILNLSEEPAVWWNLTGGGFSDVNVSGGVNITGINLSGVNITAGNGITLKNVGNSLNNRTITTSGGNINITGTDIGMSFTGSNITTTGANGDINIDVLRSVTSNVTLTATGNISFTGRNGGGERGIHLTNANFTAGGDKTINITTTAAAGSLDFGSLTLEGNNIFKAGNINLNATDTIGSFSMYSAGKALALKGGTTTFEGVTNITASSEKGSAIYVRKNGLSTLKFKGDATINASANMSVGSGNEGFSGALVLYGQTRPTEYANLSVVLDNSNLTMNITAPNSIGITGYTSNNLNISGTGNVSMSLSGSNYGAVKSNRNVPKLNINLSDNYSAIINATSTGGKALDIRDWNLKNTTINATTTSGGTAIEVNGSSATLDNVTLNGTSDTGMGVRINDGTFSGELNVNGTTNGANASGVYVAVSGRQFNSNVNIEGKNTASNGNAVTIANGTFNKDLTITGTSSDTTAGYDSGKAAVILQGGMVSGALNVTGTSNSGIAGVRVANSPQFKGTTQITGTSSSGDGVFVGNGTMVNNTVGTDNRQLDKITLSGTTTTGKGVNLGNGERAGLTVTGTALGAGSAVALGSGNILDNATITANANGTNSKGLDVSADSSNANTVTLKGTTSVTATAVGDNSTAVSVAGNDTQTATLQGDGQGLGVTFTITASGTDAKGVDVSESGTLKNFMGEHNKATVTAQGGKAITVSGDLSNVKFEASATGSNSTGIEITSSGKTFTGSTLTAKGSSGEDITAVKFAGGSSVTLNTTTINGVIDTGTDSGTGVLIEDGASVTAQDENSNIVGETKWSDAGTTGVDIRGSVTGQSDSDKSFIKGLTAGGTAVSIADSATLTSLTVEGGATGSGDGINVSRNALTNDQNGVTLKGSTATGRGVYLDGDFDTVARQNLAIDGQSTGSGSAVVLNNADLTDGSIKAEATGEGGTALKATGNNLSLTRVTMTDIKTGSSAKDATALDISSREAELNGTRITATAEGEGGTGVSIGSGTSLEVTGLKSGSEIIGTASGKNGKGAVVNGQLQDVTLTGDATGEGGTGLEVAAAASTSHTQKDSVLKGTSSQGAGAVVSGPGSTVLDNTTIEGLASGTDDVTGLKVADNATVTVTVGGATPALTGKAANGGADSVGADVAGKVISSQSTTAVVSGSSKDGAGLKVSGDGLANVRVSGETTGSGKGVTVSGTHTGLVVDATAGDNGTAITLDKADLTNGALNARATGANSTAVTVAKGSGDAADATSTLNGTTVNATVTSDASNATALNVEGTLKGGDVAPTVNVTVNEDATNSKGIHVKDTGTLDNLTASATTTDGTAVLIEGSLNKATVNGTVSGNGNGTAVEIKSAGKAFTGSQVNGTVADTAGNSAVAVSLDGSSVTLKDGTQITGTANASGSTAVKVGSASLTAEGEKMADKPALKGVATGDATTGIAFSGDATLKNLVAEGSSAAVNGKGVSVASGKTLTLDGTDVKGSASGVSGGDGIEVAGTVKTGTDGAASTLTGKANGGSGISALSDSVLEDLSQITGSSETAAGVRLAGATVKNSKLSGDSETGDGVQVASGTVKLNGATTVDGSVSGNSGSGLNVKDGATLEGNEAAKVTASSTDAEATGVTGALISGALKNVVLDASSAGSATALKIDGTGKTLEGSTLKGSSENGTGAELTGSTTLDHTTIEGLASGEGNVKGVDIASGASVTVKDATSAITGKAENGGKGSAGVQVSGSVAGQDDNTRPVITGESKDGTGVNVAENALTSDTKGLTLKGTTGTGAGVSLSGANERQNLNIEGTATAGGGKAVDLNGVTLSGGSLSATASGQGSTALHTTGEVKLQNIADGVKATGTEANTTAVHAESGSLTLNSTKVNATVNGDNSTALNVGSEANLKTEGDKASSAITATANGENSKGALLAGKAENVKLDATANGEGNTVGVEVAGDANTLKNTDITAGAQNGTGVLMSGKSVTLEGVNITGDSGNGQGVLVNAGSTTTLTGSSTITGKVAENGTGTGLKVAEGAKVEQGDAASRLIGDTRGTAASTGADIAGSVTGKGKSADTPFVAGTSEAGTALKVSSTGDNKLTSVAMAGTTSTGTGVHVAADSGAVDLSDTNLAATSSGTGKAAVLSGANEIRSADITATAGGAGTAVSLEGANLQDGTVTAKAEGKGSTAVSVGDGTSTVSDTTTVTARIGKDADNATGLSVSGTLKGADKLTVTADENALKETLIHVKDTGVLDGVTLSATTDDGKAVVIDGALNNAKVSGTTTEGGTAVEITSSGKTFTGSTVTGTANGTNNGVAVALNNTDVTLDSSTITGNADASGSTAVAMNNATVKATGEKDSNKPAITGKASGDAATGIAVSGESALTNVVASGETSATGGKGVDVKKGATLALSDAEVDGKATASANGGASGVYIAGKVSGNGAGDTSVLRGTAEGAGASGAQLADGSALSNVDVTGTTTDGTADSQGVLVSGKVALGGDTTVTGNASDKDGSATGVTVRGNAEVSGDATATLAGNSAGTGDGVDLAEGSALSGIGVRAVADKGTALDVNGATLTDMKAEATAKGDSATAVNISGTTTLNGSTDLTGSATGEAGTGVMLDKGTVLNGSGTAIVTGIASSESGKGAVVTGTLNGARLTGQSLAAGVGLDVQGDNALKDTVLSGVSAGGNGAVLNGHATLDHSVIEGLTEGTDAEHPGAGLVIADTASVSVGEGDEASLVSGRATGTHGVGVDVSGTVSGPADRTASLVTGEADGKQSTGVRVRRSADLVNTGVTGTSGSGTGVDVEDGALTGDQSDIRLTGHTTDGTAVAVAGSDERQGLTIEATSDTGTAVALDGVNLKDSNITASTTDGRGVAFSGESTLSGADTVISGKASGQGTGVSVTGSLAATGDAPVTLTGESANGSGIATGGETTLTNLVLNGGTTDGQGVALSGDTTLTATIVNGEADGQRGDGVSVTGKVTATDEASVIDGRAQGGAGVLLADADLNNIRVSGSTQTGDGVAVDGNTTLANTTVTGSATGQEGRAVRVRRSATLTADDASVVNGTASGLRGTGAVVDGALVNVHLNGKAEGDATTGLELTGNTHKDSVLTGVADSGTGARVSGNTELDNTTVNGRASGAGSAGVELAAVVTGSNGAAIAGTSDQGTGVRAASALHGLAVSGESEEGTGVDLTGATLESTTVTGKSVSGAGIDARELVSRTEDSTLSGHSGSGADMDILYPQQPNSGEGTTTGGGSAGGSTGTDTGTGDNAGTTGGDTGTAVAATDTLRDRVNRVQADVLHEVQDAPALATAAGYRGREEHPELRVCTADGECETTVLSLKAEDALNAPEVRVVPVSRKPE